MKKGAWEGGRCCFNCCEVGHLAFESLKNDKNSTTNIKETAVATTIPSAHLKKERSTSNVWMINTAYTSHILNDLRSFLEFTSIDCEVQVGNNETILKLGIDTILVCSVLDGEQNYITLHDFFYAPDIMYNLISISKVRNCKFKTITDNEYKRLGLSNIKMLHKSYNEV